MSDLGGSTGSRPSGQAPAGLDAPRIDPGRKELRLRCRDCFETHLESELLSAPSPFDPTDEIVGCPNCLSACEFDHMCDFNECQRIVSGGHPTPGGYVHRCWDHSPSNPAFQGANQ